MKKLFLVMAAIFCVASASAQKWAVGGRVGSGLQAVGEYHYAEKPYVEARFGMQWVAGLAADFTALHNWNVCKMDWTPSAGKWYFDAGVGVNVGGVANVAYVGVAGMAKLGFQFNKLPLKLALDFTPSFGPIIGYARVENISFTTAGFFTHGICNLGVSAVYCF